MEGDVRSYRNKQSQGAASAAIAWSTSGAFLVCVGPHDGAEHAVRSSARLASQLNVNWHAIYVETPALQRLPSAVRDRTLSVLKLAEELGASTAVVSADNIAVELLRQAQALNCATLVTGRPRARRWQALRRLIQPTITRQLAELAPSLDIIEVGIAASTRQLPQMVPRNHQEGEASLSRLPEGRFGWQRYALAAASCVATTLLVLPLHPLLDMANIVMLFLLYVVMVALKLGRGPAMLAAVCGVASFDFFFVAPRFSFAVNDVQYLVTFAVMLFVSLLIGQLTARLRFSARISASRERRARGLFELTRDLSAAFQAVQIVDLGKAAVERTFGGQAIALLPDATDKLVFGDNLPDSIDTSIVDWAYRHGQRAGLATSTLSAHAWHYVPLQAPIRIRGVLALQPAQPRWLLIPEQIQQLETPARPIAIAIERAISRREPSRIRRLPIFRFGYRQYWVR